MDDNDRTKDRRIIIDLRQEPCVLYEIENDYIKKYSGKVVDHKRKIALFMKKATYLSILLDCTRCIFKNNRISHMKTLLTDGNFIWSADLNHYVKHHSLQLPQFFVSYMDSVNYKTFFLSDDKYKDILSRVYDKQGYLNIDSIKRGTL